MLGNGVHLYDICAGFIEIPFYGHLIGLSLVFALFMTIDFFVSLVHPVLPPMSQVIKQSAIYASALYAAIFILAWTYVWIGDRLSNAFV